MGDDAGREHGFFGSLGLAVLIITISLVFIEKISLLWWEHFLIVVVPHIVIGLIFKFVVLRKWG
tara:strand:- start:22369 stop:22560 length:192 start_codon:yes stop_codon:yes gene_type:complete